VGSRWAAQAHEPAYRPFKSQMSQMLVNRLQTLSPSGLDVGSPSPRACLSPIPAHSPLLRYITARVNLNTSVLPQLLLPLPRYYRNCCSYYRGKSRGNRGFFRSFYRVSRGFPRGNSPCHSLLKTSGPSGLEVGSPSPRARLSPIQKSDVVNVG